MRETKLTLCVFFYFLRWLIRGTNLTMRSPSRCLVCWSERKASCAVSDVFWTQTPDIFVKSEWNASHLLSFFFNRRKFWDGHGSSSACCQRAEGGPALCCRSPGLHPQLHVRIPTHIQWTDDVFFNVEKHSEKVWSLWFWSYCFSSGNIMSLRVW